jgi:hypothetical protein
MKEENKPNNPTIDTYAMESIWYGYRMETMMNPRKRLDGREDGGNCS